MKITKLDVFTAVCFAAMLTSAPVSFAQTNLNFTKIGPNNAGSITLNWNSRPNEVYEIDYADQLDTNYDGSTVWNTLSLYNDPDPEQAGWMEDRLVFDLSNP